MIIPTRIMIFSVLLFTRTSYTSEPCQAGQHRKAHPKLRAIVAEAALERIQDQPKTREEQIMALYEENIRKDQVIKKLQDEIKRNKEKIRRIQQEKNSGYQLPKRTTQQRQQRASSSTQPVIVCPIPQRPSMSPFVISFLKDQPH